MPATNYIAGDDAMGRAVSVEPSFDAQIRSAEEAVDAANERRRVASIAVNAHIDALAAVFGSAAVSVFREKLLAWDAPVVDEIRARHQIAVLYARQRTADVDAHLAEVRSLTERIESAQVRATGYRELITLLADELHRRAKRSGKPIADEMLAEHVNAWRTQSEAPF